MILSGLHPSGDPDEAVEDKSTSGKQLGFKTACRLFPAHINAGLGSTCMTIPIPH